jgi:hypothetical protein
MSDDQLIDKRTIERNIKKGRVDSAEYGRTLAALPDLSGKLWRREEPRPQPAAEPAPAAAAPVAEPAAAEPAAAEPAAAPESESVHGDWNDDTNQPAPFG